MQFIIQHNLLSIEKLEKTRQAVAAFPHQFVGIIPFSDEISCDEPIVGNNYIPYGSTRMMTMGLERYNWKGLFLDLNEFNYSTALKNRDDMLNSNVITLSKAVEELKTMSSTDVVFVRPSEDLKQFTGQVIEAKECHDWFKDMMLCESSGSYKLEPDTQIVMCEPQNIKAEWRWFVVNGKVVSGSMYRSNKQLKQERVVETDMIKKAQKFADKWLPSPCCVMDLALVGDDLKVVEFNCINASGAYDNDLGTIFKELYNYCITLED